MLIDFFYTLRSAKLPVSVKEYLTLLEALQADVVGPNSDGAYGLDDFYYLSRTALVKDEKHYDKFDRAFAALLQGRRDAGRLHQGSAARLAAQDARARVHGRGKGQDREDGLGRAHGDAEEALRGAEGPPRRRQQVDRHWRHLAFRPRRLQPQGVRIGGAGKNKSAVKVWDQRAYKDYDDSQELGTRNIKIALRRLRKFAREGHEEELDLDDTIHSTAANAGYLDIKMRPERHNNVKVLLLMDVGGTMDEHIQRVEELFSAVKTEFKHLEFYYFHNCVYDFMWKNNRRRFSEKFATWDIIRKYNKDYKLIFVGDATMSPYEILQPGGSVEYNNEEAGAEWMQRLTHAFPKFAWINPEPQGVWQYRQSIAVIQQLVSHRMYPLTLRGLEDAMRMLSK